jgi:hypothetical protein
MTRRAGVHGVALARLSGVGNRSAIHCHFLPKWVTGLWLLLGITALLFGTGCRRGVPVADLAATDQGTISGTVRGPEAASPLAGRAVHVVNTATGERRTVRSASNGGFTVEVPAGRYRLELALRDGETLVKRPGIVDMDRGDVDRHVEFVLGPARVSRPRGPGYRMNDGLGSPVA